MLGLCCNDTYKEMTNCDYGDDKGDYVGSEDGNDDDNAAPGSVSNGPIFDLIMIPRSHGRILCGDDGGNTATTHYIYNL